MAVSATIAPVAHLNILSGISLIQQVSMELSHPFLVPVLIVLTNQYLVLQLLTENETTEYRLQLLSNDLLLCYDLRHGRNEEHAHQYQHHRDISKAIVVPSVSIDSRNAANVDHEQSSNRQKVPNHYENVVTDFSIPQKRNHVQRVQNLRDYHNDAGDLGRFEQGDEGDDNDATSEKGDKYIIFGIPSLTGHLLQQYVVMRVIYLKALPVASHQQSHHHNHELYQGQDRQYECKHLEFLLSANRCYLYQAGKEKHVEHERDDSSRKGYFLPSDQDGCGIVWDSIHQNKQQPEYSQENHHHNELCSERIRKTVILNHAKVSPLQRNGSAFESIAPCDQRKQLNVLKDISIDSLAHCQHEQMHACDDDGDGYERRQSCGWLWT